MSAGKEALRPVDGDAPARVDRLAPTTITADDAGLANGLVQRLPAELHLGAFRGVIDLDVDNAPRVTRWPVELHLSLSAMPARIALSETLLDGLLDQSVPISEFIAMPPPLRAGLLAVRIEPLLDALGEIFPGGVELVEVATRAAAPDPADLAFTVRFADRSGDHGIRAPLRLRNGIAARRLLVALSRLGSPLRRIPPEVPFAAGIELGPVALTPTELRGLRQGDVILPGTRADQDRFLLRAAGRIVARAVEVDGAFRLESMSMSEKKPEQATPETNGASAKQSPLMDVDSLNVAVTVEIGSTELGLETLSGLRPGYVLTIPRSAPDRAVIRANGRIVGRGELVRVGEELGVRVLATEQSDEPGDDA